MCAVWEGGGGLGSCLSVRVGFGRGGAHVCVYVWGSGGGLDSCLSVCVGFGGGGGIGLMTECMCGVWEGGGAGLMSECIWSRGGGGHVSMGMQNLHLDNKKVM